MTHSDMINQLVHALTAQVRVMQKVLLIPVVSVVVLLAACVVRTHAYLCTATLADGSHQEIDLEMNPTDLRIKTQEFAFVEEVGVERIYRSSQGETLRFNAASNVMTQGGMTWTCRRY